MRVRLARISAWAALRPSSAFRARSRQEACCASLLHVYVRDPVVPNRAIQPERLAAVSGRTVAALTHALTGLPKPRNPDRVRPRVETTQAARKQRLFAAVRTDAARGLSIRQLAARHHTHRRTIRQALTSPTPGTNRTRPVRAEPRHHTRKNLGNLRLPGTRRTHQRLTSPQPHPVGRLMVAQRRGAGDLVDCDG